MRFAVLIGASIVGLATAVAGQALPDESVQVQFPARWLPMLYAAYGDFRAARSDLSCFNISARKDGDVYRISFMPPSGVDVDGDRVTIPVVPGSSSCGRGMFYEFDKAGVLISRTGVR